MSLNNTSIGPRELEIILANNKLVEYLSMISTDELLELKRSILCDDIVGPRVTILSAIEDAIEYRFLEQFISLQDAEFISRGFDLNLNVKNYEEIKNSFEELENYGDFQSIVRWCPALLYLDRTYKVFVYLKQNGKSIDEIVAFFCSSYDRFIRLADSLDDRRLGLDMKSEFHELLLGIVNKVNNNKADTESYIKYTNQMFTKNADLLKRLS